MRIVKNFNQDWLFIPEMVTADHPDQHFEAITLPHTNKLYDTRYVDNSTYQFVSTYRKRFSLDENITGKRVFLDFDGAMLRTTVYLNGTKLGENKRGYSPFSFDLTDHLQKDENLLTVYVDATEDKAIPPYGGLVDYLTFGGIYRDVSLRIVDPCHIANIFVRPLDVLTAPRVECDVQLSDHQTGMQLSAIIKDANGATIAEQTQTINAERLTLRFDDLKPIALWTLDNPALYTLHLTLSSQTNGLDDLTTRFGFRTAEFRKHGAFYLNGEPLKLFGLNRHQTYPFIGSAAPKRLQEFDADVLKYELGCNIVRTSHYPQSPHFLNRCDEIGLLVFEEIAGWQHIGADEAWQSLIMDDLRAMIERDRNHPSIILWGVRINESPDDDALYECTNLIAHQLDPTRQTGGVRNFAESHFLEDVFTLNDFTEGIQTPRPPHLITEFAGHMYPTKTWDHEARRLEHALKHARKHNLQFGHPGVSGAIGWCAFDYHTHKEFGSGDRICHHGVMDLFRLPKMAAHFYRSQKSPADEIVLYAATNWTMGDRDGGGNNPLVIFSNCDAVEVLVDDKSEGCFQPDTDTYPHLPHPPFTVQWPEPYNPWGTQFESLEVRGYLKEQCVATHRITADHIPQALALRANTIELQADGADMAWIAVQLIDRYGNVLPYHAHIVQWTLEGDATFIGENPMALLGGQGACFIKAGHTAGEVTITAQAKGLTPVFLKIQIVP